MATTPKSHTNTDNELLIPLNKLKKSPKNARKMPHGETAIEALAASIAAKGLLQNLVVEPEVDTDGAATGYYLVTIGEGRRLAQLLRVKRKEIKKTEPIRCALDVANDPTEISLDENITRNDLHPADQFEVFKYLAQEKRYSAEDIAARSVSFTAGRRGDRAGRARRGAGQGGGDHPGSIARRIGSVVPSQSWAPACAFAAGGADHRAREHALSVRLRRRDDEDRRGCQRAARCNPGAMAGAGDAPPEIRLP